MGTLVADRRDDAGVAGLTPQPHPRTLGWLGTTALAMGGSNQSLFLMAALIVGQGSAAVPLLILGLLLSWAAAPGWTELILMWPNRVGGIAATCAEAFRPYSPVLANARFDDTASEWLRGKTVWEGNGLIITKLRDLGVLLAEEKITHSYPHDWRSKTPIIFRATEQ